MFCEWILLAARVFFFSGYGLWIMDWRLTLDHHHSAIISTITTIPNTKMNGEMYSKCSNSCDVCMCVCVKTYIERIKKKQMIAGRLVVQSYMGFLAEKKQRRTKQKKKENNIKRVMKPYTHTHTSGRINE